MNLSFDVHCTVAFFVRVILIVYGHFHDKFLRPGYTDVDYRVFTDAARHVVEGGSPFDRHTYRYSPLLAWFLTPNIFLHPAFGKVLFSLVDILIGILIKNILARQTHNDKNTNICAFLWLYNPLTIVISTRGNADSIAVLLVILTLDLLQKNKFVMAGLLHGMSVHFRLYPIAFSLAMFLSLRQNNNIIPNVNQCKLTFSCIASIALLTALCYYIYGYKFLYESLLYHLLRKDTKHNFSVFFYMLYLTGDQQPNVLQKIFTFLPQLTLLLVLSYRYSDKADLPFAMFTQAMVIVAYNPVLTSQYFFWFLSLLPLCLLNIRMNVRRFLTLSFAWVSSQGVWLLAAYFLEFEGVNTFTFIWLAGLLFFAVNVKILIDVVARYKTVE